MENRNVKHGFRHNLRRAFTITELVIVIAVVAVLAAVLIPTFSNVIESSKKSHDEQFVKEMNVSLNAYAVEHGAGPADYEELMYYLAEEGYCDASNKFLLGTKLKQDNVYLVWYPRSNYIMLVNLDEGKYNITFSAEVGLGNGVLVHDTLGNSSTLGYTLCTTGTADSAYIAEMYQKFYVDAGGDINAFNQYGYTADAIKNNVSDKVWGSSIAAAITNQKLSYTFSSSVESAIKEQAATTNNVITLDVPATSGAGAVSAEVQEQSIRSTLATLVTMSNDTESAELLAKKEIEFGEGGESLADVTVDMADVTMSAIHPTHRDSIKAEQSLPSSFSVDFGGLTLENYNVTESFVASGASWQSGDDNDYTGGAYNYAYGMFGTLYAKEGETVVIENISIKGVNLELDGATYDAAGNAASIISDSAGIICGTALGNVVFRNIDIDGTQPNGQKGYMHGYDALGSIVGRAYGTTQDHANGKNMVTIEDCHVSNLAIYGVRKVGGFCGIWSAGNFLTVRDSSLSNVDVVGMRDLPADSADDRKSTIAALLVAHTQDSGNLANETAHYGSVFENVTITDCTTFNHYKQLDNNEWVILDGGLNVAMPESYDATGTAGQTEHENYLKLFANLSTYCFKISGLTVKTGDWSQTFNFTYDTPKSENGTAFTCSNSLEPVLLNDLVGA